MPVETLLRGDLSGRTADVNPYRGLMVGKQPYPPYGGPTVMRCFRQFLSLDGTSTGTSDMRIDASATDQAFYVPAHDDRDRYICRLSFVISDAAAALNSFGTLTALSTGCKLSYEDELGEVIIHSSLTTNFNFVRLCQGEPAFGQTNNAFRANNVSGASEGFIPTLDLRNVFGFEWGLRLAATTDQRLVLTVRDDTTGVDAFNAIAYGFERLPDPE